MTTSSYLFYETLGYAAALGSALSWALGSILFRKVGEEVSPLGMNIGKCTIGILYLGIALLFVGIEAMSSRSFLILGISGLLGIAVGDTFFFKALISIGPRLTVLLGTTLGPLFTIFLAVVFLNEKLSSTMWVGAALILSGVNFVLWEEGSEEKVKKKWVSGIIYALLAALCMSLSIIFAKVVVVEVPTLQATFIRILWGVIGLTVWGLINRQLKNWVIPFKSPPLIRLILLSVFVIIFGGFWLSIVALKYIDASIATILNSTEPLFVLPLTAFILKEKVTIREIGGAIVAVIGVSLIFIG